MILFEHRQIEESTTSELFDRPLHSDSTCW